MVLMGFSALGFAHQTCVELVVESSRVVSASKIFLRLTHTEVVESSRHYSLPIALLEGGKHTSPEVLLDRWQHLQDYPAVQVYEQLVVRWAKALESAYGSEVADLFIATVINRRSHRYDLSSRLFGTLPSLEDFREVLSALRPRPGQIYTAQRIQDIQDQMLRTLEQGLEQMAVGILAAESPEDFLRSELDAAGIDPKDDDYSLSIAHQGNRPVYFVRLNLSHQQPLLPNWLKYDTAARVTGANGEIMGAVLSIPKYLAESMAKDITEVLKWIDKSR